MFRLSMVYLQWYNIHQGSMKMILEETKTIEYLKNKNNNTQKVKTLILSLD